jgi:hypothetical protein
VPLSPPLPRPLPHPPTHPTPHRHLASRLGDAAQREADLERRLADKQRAFHLLHADLAAQRGLVEEAEAAAAAAGARLAGVVGELAGARAAAAEGEACRAALEVARMWAEDMAGEGKGGEALRCTWELRCVGQLLHPALALARRMLGARACTQC